MVGRGAQGAMPGGTIRASPRQRAQKHPPPKILVRWECFLFSCSSPRREALRPVCLSIRITPRFRSRRFGACLGGALQFPTAWLFLVCGNSMNSRKDPSPLAAASLPPSGTMTFTASPAEDKPCCCLW